MKKIFLVCIFTLSLLISGGTIGAQATSSDIFPVNKDNKSLFFDPKNPDKEIKLSDYTLYDDKDTSLKEEDIEGKKGQFLFRKLANQVIDYMKRLLIPIAILWTVWAGLSLIMSRGEEEEFTKRWHHIYGLAIGFMIILLSSIIVDDVFFGNKGEILREEMTISDSGVITGAGKATIEKLSQEGVKQMKGIFQYFTSFAILAGVAYVIFSAVKMLLAGGEDESQISKLKQRIVFVITGMIILVSAPELIKIFTESNKPGEVDKLMVPNASKLIELGVDWGNFILGIVGVFAVFGIVWGGFRLITSFGVDEKASEDAKKIVTASVIGLAIAFSAWTLMYYFLVH